MFSSKQQELSEKRSHELSGFMQDPLNTVYE